MILKMAWRNIGRNKLRSIVIMISIVIGIFAGIAVSALYKGMMAVRVKTVIEEETGHIQIHTTNFKTEYDPQYYIPNYEFLSNYLDTISGIKTVACRTITQGMLMSTSGSSGVMIHGVIPEKEYQFSSLHKKIIIGKLFSPSKANEIIIGKKLADKMKLKTGNKLVLTFIDTSSEIVSGAFRIIAIYKSSNTPLDERNVYVKMRDLNSMLLIGNNIHEMGILLNNEKDVRALTAKLKTDFERLEIESWKELSPETNLMLNTTQQYSYIIMMIIMTALAFGITNTMLMAIMERTHEIGMMSALGTNQMQLFFLILWETILLTLAGTPVGMGISWIVVEYFHHKGLNLSGMGEEMMSSFGFKTIIYPEFPIDQIPGILLIVIGTAILSSLLPAIKALKLNPIEALRR